MTNQFEWVQAFSVLRAPEVLRADVDLNLQIKVVSVWPDEKSATTEVARLTGLSQASGQRYWWQSTHLFPKGRATG
ncbi:MAG: hypothetical protein ACT4P1_16655 [Sporichthyaceae bacterium]